MDRTERNLAVCPVPAQENNQICAVSMKAPELPGAVRRPAFPVRVHNVQLCSRPTTKGRHETSPADLGYLAPPRNEHEARARKLRELMISGSVVVIVGSVVMLAIWLLAGYMG